MIDDSGSTIKAHLRLAGRLRQVARQLRRQAVRLDDVAGLSMMWRVRERVHVCFFYKFRWT